MNSFKRNLILGYSFSLVLLLGSAIASFISINNLINNNDRVDHTNTVIRKLENVITILINAETGQRGFLLTGEPEFLDPFDGSLEQVYREVKELRQLTTDNQLQQLSLIKLTDLVQNRMNILQKLVTQKKSGETATNEQLREGKSYMDQVRQLVSQMEERENQLLVERTREAKKFAESTPLFIIIASMLAILITLLSFFRVSRDFQRRQLLQQELVQKDREVTERINIISGIAEKISAGNYGVRLQEGFEDKLGKLAASLNKMTGSLDDAFTLLSKKEWLQSGLSQLNEKMLGEQTLESAAKNVLEQLTNYTESNISAFYHADQGKLLFIKGFAFLPPEDKKILQPGEGLAGQAMVSMKMIAIKNIQSSDIMINYAAGDIRPQEIVAIPMVFEGVVKAVLMLGTVRPYQDKHKEYLQSVSDNIAIVVNTVETRQRLNELLQKTQAQSEELGAQTEELSVQHAELESSNAELEAQAEKLKVSEEELKVQQEELMQSNSELEERTRLLEERNHIIAEQNRDIEYKAEQLEISSQYKSEFLANMSHELRTPLNSILLLSRLMADNMENNLSEEQVEYANVIQGSGRGLLSLIDEILDLSKIEAGKMDIHYADVRTAEITENMRSLFKPVASDKKLEFDIEIEPAAASSIETDIQRVEQVLKNLLSNAFKFTSTGKVSLRVTRPGEGKISFAVTDTGIGISKDKQQFVFEAFRQEDGSTRRNYGGTGLGLSISRELARLLGGEISLVSEQGKGSVFTFTIPVSRQAPAKPVTRTTTDLLHPAGVFEQPLVAQKKVSTEPIPGSIPDDRDNIGMKDKVILIIEDDKVFAKALLDFTRKNGYKGVVAVRGDEGVQLARELLPIGILLDIYLPVLDGWEVMEVLKSESRTKHIPVHIMSSLEVKNRSLTAGAINFSNKPLAVEGMRDIFHKIEQFTNKTAKKVLIVEENSMHAKALEYFLEENSVQADIMNNIDAAIGSLEKEGTDCVILDMGVPGKASYEMLEQVRKTKGLENIPIIVFTGKSLSQAEELKIKKYADSIVVKTAHSYKRMLDEVSLFLHLMETSKSPVSLSEKSRMLHDVLANKKVLLVDDDVRNIYSLTKAMEQYNINVISAIDGKDAIRQLEANKDVQLVLMDMMMPEMDGYETTRYIRGIAAYSKLPVIAVTAKAMSGDREKCIEAGASDYITKPVDTDQLISLLRVWLYQS